MAIDDVYAKLENAMPARIDAVIFDMDGLLIDSEPLWQEAEMAVFATVDLHLTVELCRQTTGMRIDEVVEYHFRQTPWDEARYSRRDITNHIIDELIARVRQRGRALPGVEKTLTFLAGRQVPLALASSSSMRIIEAVMEVLNLQHYFSVLHSAENETYGKPHPAAFLTTANRLGVPPSGCLVFEDSLNGVIAAKAARMICIAVPEAHHRSDPRFALTDILLNSLEEFTPELWSLLNDPGKTG